MMNNEYSDFDEFLILDEDIDVLCEANTDKAVLSYMVNVISHMMKLQYQPEKQTKSWLNTIANSYKSIMEICEEESYNKVLRNPTLNKEKIYKLSINRFEKDTHIHTIKEVPDALEIEVLMSGKKRYILKYIEIWGYPELIEFSKTLNYGC